MPRIRLGLQPKTKRRGGARWGVGWGERWEVTEVDNYRRHRKNRGKKGNRGRKAPLRCRKKFIRHYSNGKLKITTDPIRCQVGI